MFYLYFSGVLVVILQREIDEPRRRVSPMADDRPLPAAAMTPHDDNDLDQTIGRRTSRNVVSQAPRGPPLEKPFPGDRPIHPAKAPAFDAAEAGAEDEENDDGSAFASGAAGEVRYVA